MFKRSSQIVALRVNVHIQKKKKLSANNSERPVDALAIKKVNRPLTDNIKSRDASASKNGWYS